MAKKGDDDRIIDGLNEELKGLGLDPIENVEDEQEEETEEKVENQEESEEDESEDNDSEEDDDESTDEDESEDDSENDSDEDDEDDDEDSDSDRRPKKYIPIKKYQSEKKKHREEMDALKTIVDGLQKKAEGKGDESTTEENDEIKALADELGIEDPENFKKVLGFIEKQVGKKVQIDPSILEAVEKIKQQNAADEDTRYFGTKWEGLLPTFKDDFANATKENIQAAKVLMDKIWHTEEWHKFDIDYVYFKNKDAFKKIISPRNKGLETGSSNGGQRGNSGNGKTLALSENASEDDVLKAADQIAAVMAGHNSLRPTERKSI